MPQQSKSYTQYVDEGIAAGVDMTDTEDLRDTTSLVGKWRNLKHNVEARASSMYHEARRQMGKEILPAPLTLTDQKQVPGFIPDAPSSAPPSFIPDGPSANNSASTIPPDATRAAFNAAVHGKMLGVSPGAAYLNREDIDKNLRATGGDYDNGEIDSTIMNDIKVGLQDSIFGLHKRQKLADEIRDPGMVDKFVKGLTSTIADVPFMLAGGVIGGAAGSEVPVVGNVVGAGAGAFALPAAVREGLVLGIKNGQVKGYGDLLRRVADITWAGTKGAVTGAVTELAGGIPVAGFVARSGAASVAMKGLYQATALTTTADLLEGRVPNAKDFAGNAALILPLNLITHGAAMGRSEAEQAAMDVYARDGKHPAETANTLAAQPTVKMDAPEGLKPAIQVGEDHIVGDVTDTHSTLATRMLGKKPVEMQELEADPQRADEVLENPIVHEQSVIDRAWEIKKAEIDAGETDKTLEGDKPLRIEDIYDRASLKSGRGFSTPSTQFLSRMEARSWMKENEPETHEMWTKVVEGDKQAELHSEDYAEARNRTQARAVAGGDAEIAKVSPQNASRLAAAREGLNKIKAGTSAKSYGREVLRTLFVGQRDTRIAATTQLRDVLKKMLPDFRDQEALSILRDYKGFPEKLSADLEEILEGDSDRMKALVPSIERAANPTPELLAADKQLTDYYKNALEEGRELGFMDSTIDPENYSPHMLTRILDGEKPQVGTTRSAMAQSTPFAKERNYRTILDALKTERLDARTVNALDALSVYGDRHATVVATKILAAELRNTEIGKFGTQENHPEGWVELAPGQAVFKNSRAVVDPETGQGFVMSQSLYVPKDVADAMRPIIEQNILASQPGVKGIKAVQAFTKSMELGLSFFHMKALTITAMNNMSFADFTRSLASDLKSPEFASAEREAAADGLTTSKTSTPYEAYQGLKESSIKDAFDVRELPGLKQIDAISQWLTHETFDVIQRKFKVQDFSLKTAAWIGKHPEATAEETFAARRSIAKEVNSVYGGLNWEVMGWGKNARELTRMVMLAPDWTFSNVANLKYAGEGGPAGSAARMFWVKSFATGIAMTQATSLAVSGQLSKHPTEVYMGKDKDGKEIYSNTFFAGAPKDAISLVSRVQRDGPIEGMAEFLVAKLGPVASTVVGEAANKDGAGRPIDKKSDSFGVKSAKQGEFIGGKAVPITVKLVAQMLTDGKQHSMVEYMGAIAGTTTTHQGSTSSSEGSSKPASPMGKTSRGTRRFTIRKGR